MSKTHMWLFGGIGLVGLVVIVAMMRDSGGSSETATNTTPQPPPVGSLAEAPGGVPSYPAPPPLPAFNVNATPYYLTVNMPTDRSAGAPTNAGKKSGCGGCKGKCGDQSSTVQTFSQTAISTQSNDVRRLFQAASKAGSNITEQFPPDQFSWMYQSGGHA